MNVDHGIQIPDAPHGIAQPQTEKRGMAKETLKVSAIAAALFAVAKGVFPRSNLAYRAIFIAPVLEEVLFRGILLSFMKKSMEKSHPPESQADLKAQQVFRARVSGVLFGLAHFLNGFSSATVLQVLKTSITGVRLGYITEKTHSIAIPILLHGLNNIVAIGAIFQVIPFPIALAAGLGVDLATVYLSKHPHAIDQKMDQIADGCIKTCRSACEKVKAIWNRALNPERLSDAARAA